MYGVRSDKSATMFLDFYFELFVYGIDILALESIAVGRIGDQSSIHECWIVGFLDKIRNRKSDILSHSGSFCISPCHLDHRLIYIGGEYLIFTTRIDLVLEFVFGLQEDRPIVKGKWLDTEVAMESWGNTTSHHRCLDSDRPTSAEWIEKRFTKSPVRECDERCGEIFLDRSLAWLGAIPALMEWITRDIEEHSEGIIHDEEEDMNLDTTCIIRGIERREYCSLSDRLDRRSAREWRSGRWRLDDDVFSASKVLTPTDGCQDIVECVEVSYLFFGHLDIDSIGKPASYEELIYCLKISCPAHETILSSGVLESQFLWLSSDEWLESWLTSERDIELLKIYFFRFWYGFVGDNLHGESV